MSHQPLSSTDARHVHAGPLHGTTVVDLSRVMAGPFCTTLLSELGARIIKVEQREQGDDARTYGPFVNGRSCYFAALNRDKESIALDLKDAGDREVLDQLLSKADVLVENFRPGVMEKLGLGWDEVHQRHPQLIMTSVSGYGQSGPLARQPAYDAIVQAESGLMSVTGEDANSPCRVGVSIADSGTALYACIATLAALHKRHLTGLGTHADIAMFDCMLSLMDPHAVRYLTTGVIARPIGTANPAIAPFEGFETQSGTLIIACGNDKQFQVLSHVLGCPGLAAEPAFATNDLRVMNRQLLRLRIEEALRAEDADHWEKAIRAAGIPAGRINTIAQALDHPSVAARNLLASVDDPVIGDLRFIGNPFKFSGVADRMTRAPAPELDEHGEALRTEFTGQAINLQD